MFTKFRWNDILEWKKHDLTRNEQYALCQHGLVSIVNLFRHEFDLSQLVSFNFIQNNTQQIKVYKTDAYKCRFLKREPLN
jgi:hypothetical protein